jgi:hypothetical protein
MITSRSLVLATSAAGLLAALGACGDDTSSSGSGGASASSGDASSSGETTSAASTSAASTATAAGTGGGPGVGGAGGTGSGGEGGEGGATCTPDEDFAVLETPPGLLSETGLYEAGTLDVDPRLRGYTPEFQLWSDGLDKSRWVYLPPCETIDTTDLDHWDFPVGARFYKEFRLGDARIETRVIHRFGPGPDDWWYAAYHWASETDAVHVPAGVVDANGTTHDIPAQEQCVGCHGYLPEVVLGFNTIELAHEDAGDGELELDELIEAGKLSAPPDFDIAIPAADPTERQALGYLHANCGYCHAEGGVFLATPMDMRLSVFDADREDTGVFRTAVDVPTDTFMTGGVTHRINPGDPATSCVNYRMGTRPGMPPFGTEEVDDDAKANMDAWVTDLD